MSHGALFNHFGSRHELMAACVDEVLPRFVSEGTDKLLTLAASPERPIQQVVDLLWVQFSGPTMQAVRELMMAGRTNDTLSASIQQLDTAVRNANARLASLLVPELAGNPHLPGIVGLTVAAIDGAVFSNQGFRNPERHAATKVALVRALELLVADATADEQPAAVIGASDEGTA